jgi:tetratricopeptide (TPR) repeat protein
MITPTTKPASAEQLTADDFTLLGRRFAREAEQMFPMPVSVKVYFSGKTAISVGSYRLPDDLLEITSVASGTNTPVYKRGVLVIPQPLEGGGHAFFLFVSKSHDQSLMKKLADSWLSGFQQTLQKQTLLVKKSCIDPVTALHNSRALDFFLQSTDDSNQYTLFLINISFIRRTAAGSLHKVQMLADFFAATSTGILFFIGQGVFALLTTAKNRRQRTSFAHNLQQLLKREVIRKVHISCAKTNNENKLKIQEELWQALGIAERRGPYGICDISALKELKNSPFALPEAGVLQKLRRKWHGVDRFALAVFQSETGTDKTTLESCIAPLVIDGEQLIVNTVKQVFVLFPQSPAAAFEDRLKCMAEMFKKTQKTSLQIGGCRYPCMEFNKTDTIRNCRKAIMHGSFYDPGSIVFFDHLTLNVSGDWYFDEGDFKQAVREYSLGLRLKPGDHNLLNSLGVSLIKMNRYTKAIESFQQVLKRKPDNYMTLVNLGYAHQARGDDHAALKFFQKALQVQTRTGQEGLEVHQQLSRLYCKAELYRQALPLIKLWSKEAKEKGFLFYRLQGEALLETGSIKEAMKSLQHALHIYAHDPESMSMLGLLYIENGEGDKTGNMLLEKALSIDESSADCWYRYGRALKYLKNFSEAMVAVKKCLRIQIHHIRAILIHGELLAITGKISKARSVLQATALKKASRSEQKRAELLLAELDLHLSSKQTK